MRLAAGRLAPRRGSVRVEGGDPARDAAVRRRIGFVPQEIGLYPRLTVAENLDVFAQLAGLKRVARRAALARLLDRCAIGPVAGQPVGTLSGGYRRRERFCIAPASRRGTPRRPFGTPPPRGRRAGSGRSPRASKRMRRAGRRDPPAPARPGSALPPEPFRSPGFRRNESGRGANGTAAGAGRVIAAAFRVMWLALLRDRAALAMAFVLPTVIFAIFATIFSGALGDRIRVHLGLADFARTPTTQRLAAALAAEPSLRTEVLRATSVAEVAGAVRRSAMDVALVLRGDLSPPSAGDGMPAAEPERPVLLIESPARALATPVVLGQFQRAQRRASRRRALPGRGRCRAHRQDRSGRARLPRRGVRREPREEGAVRLRRPRHPGEHGLGPRQRPRRLLRGRDRGRVPAVLRHAGRSLARRGARTRPRRQTGRLAGRPEGDRPRQVPVPARPGARAGRPDLPRRRAPARRRRRLALSGLARHLGARGRHGRRPRARRLRGGGLAPAGATRGELRRPARLGGGRQHGAAFSDAALAAAGRLVHAERLDDRGYQAALGEGWRAALPAWGVLAALAILGPGAALVLVSQDGIRRA